MAGKALAQISQEWEAPFLVGGGFEQPDILEGVPVCGTGDATR